MSGLVLATTRRASHLRPAQVAQVPMRSLSYFRAHPRGAKAAADPAPKADEPVAYQQKPFKDPMAGFSEKEVKEIKRDIEEQGRRAYSTGYAIIGGGMAVVLGVVFAKKQGLL